MSVIFGAFLGGNSVFAGKHLDEGVALIFVYNACLNGSEAGKDPAQLLFRASEMILVV